MTRIFTRETHSPSYGATTEGDGAHGATAEGGTVQLRNTSTTLLDAPLAFLSSWDNTTPLHCDALLASKLARPWCCTSCRVSLSIIINRYNTKEDLAARHWHGKTITTLFPNKQATTYRNTTKNNQNNLLHKKGMMIDRSRVDNARQRCDAVLHCITHSTRTSFISPTALSGLPVVIWRGAKIPCYTSS